MNNILLEGRAWGQKGFLYSPFWTGRQTLLPEAPEDSLQLSCQITWLSLGPSLVEKDGFARTGLYQTDCLVSNVIKEDSWAETNQLCLTLHEADSLLLENCKMGQTAGRFNRIKNEEQGKDRKPLTGWRSALFGLRRPRVGLTFGDCRLDTLCFQSSWAFMGNQNLSGSFTLLPWHPGWRQTHLDPRNLFQHP